MVGVGLVAVIVFTAISDHFLSEQNLINVASGLALEGFSVYTYAIAPFITMRAYEQVRVNLAISSPDSRVTSAFRRTSSSWV